MIKPLLLGLSKPQIIIEPANAKEEAMIDATMLEYERDPSSFTDWETAKKELGYDALAV